MSMPIVWGETDTGIIEGFLPFQPQIELSNYRFHRKKSAVFIFSAFRSKTLALKQTYGKISLINGYFGEKGLTVSRQF
jgi:hypothetical protein